MKSRRAAPVVFVLAIACASMLLLGAKRSGTPVPPTAVQADKLIREGETHFRHLWQLTFGGQNAEGYFSADGTKLILQSTRGDWPCDQEFVLDLKSGETRRVSTGKGRCTCGYFYDQDRRILFASTHLDADSCPPRPDYSKGYVWAVSPGYEIFTSKPDGSDLQRLTDHPGYDAEGTLSTDGQWILFTSLRDGDLDLYKMHPDGSGLTRLTHDLGYDGGGFFSHDGKKICWRCDHPRDSSAIADYKGLIEQNLVRPTHMDVWVMNSDGTKPRRITDKPGASFCPFFLPADDGLIFASNWENPTGRNFDLYTIGLNGGEPQPVTRDPDFDAFPMFSPDGKYLVFASNRGGKERGETNLFLAEWK